MNISHERLQAQLMWAVYQKDNNTALVLLMGLTGNEILVINLSLGVGTSPPVHPSEI